MRYAIAIFMLAAVPAAIGGPGDKQFDLGMAAVASRDWDKSLELLEGALADDPDNIRYGSEYRQATIKRAQALHPKEGKPEDFDRSLKFFEQLVTQHPMSSNAYLNYGFAVVDKIPAAGAITQVILPRRWDSSPKRLTSRDPGPAITRGAIVICSGL